MSERAPNREAAMSPTAPAETKTAKEEVIDMLRRLPDDLTYEDIIYHVSVLEKWKESEEASREGRVFTQEEVEERLKQWLTP